MKKSDVKKESKISEDFLEEDVYTEEGREKLTEEEEIAGWEEGFMEGASKGGSGAKCRNCGKILIEMGEVVEKVIDNENYRFCSSACVDSFEEERRKKSNKNYCKKNKDGREKWMS